ncbi:hypothetical protein Nepgr_005202 [Nepenthes gracilis]|uniref:Uncharacterized protein n=1 Tax=Nepenthes gracilis TaxID=150966 RepID=A0AAD3S2R7_NEPGR|nr:hypothetical protein Nepgr_005202 [Nepenthes gracilis]
MLGRSPRGDQCSSTSLGMLRKNIEAFRMQFEVRSPRDTVDNSILGSRQGGSRKKSKYRRPLRQESRCNRTRFQLLAEIYAKCQGVNG